MRRVSQRTLELWCWAQEGLRHQNLGGREICRLFHVEGFDRQVQSLVDEQPVEG